MSAALIQTILISAAVAAVAIGLELAWSRWRPESQRGIPAACLGAVLILLGLSMTTSWSRTIVPVSVRHAHQRSFVQNTVCLFGGSMLALFGGVWCVASLDDRRQVLKFGREAREMAQELSASQGVLASVVRSSVSGVMVLESVREGRTQITDFKCTFVNNEAHQMLGVTDVLDQNVLEMLPCLRDEGLFNAAAQVVVSKRPFIDERSTRFRDRQMWYQVSLVPHGDGLIATFTDVTDRKRTEDKLQRASRFDSLTELAGRSMLSDRIVEALTRTGRFPDYRFAVLLLDLDRFKIVNDSLGPEIGDRLLIEVAQRLRENLRELDVPARVGSEHLPARLGGDEFVVLLDGIPEPRSAMVVAERLQEVLAAPFRFDDHEVRTTASIGIVISHAGYEQPDDILRDADTAMYQAKHAGKARSVIFDEKMHKDVLQRMTLEKDLRRATEDVNFELHYQPIVVIDNLALRGFEALIRWPHPEKGMIRPDVFIGLAEEIGLIIPIGEWVLETACRQLKAWRALRGEPLRMAVNLSKVQLDDPALVGTVQRVIRDTGIDPTDLVLEITESTVMDNIDALVPVLEALRATGASLAMDDFGTGHSSLSLLHQVPIDILKVDRSFVMKAGQGDRKYDAIVRTIVRLARDLEMQVVAEGVETYEQAMMLRQLKAEYGQGYHFGKPLPCAEAEKLLSTDFRFSSAA